MGARVVAISAFLAGLGWCGPAVADPPAKGAEPSASAPKPGAGVVGLQELPPPIRLGARVNIVERQFTVIPTVVLVRNEASYVAAIASWQTSVTGALRFPVLIDDGTWAARMRIARFVRAFAPKSVVRWGAKTPAWPETPGARQERIEASAAGAWGAATPAELKKAWSTLGFVPPGVVVCSMKDPAWTAGLALAAGHGQPILWIDPPPFGDPTMYVEPQSADQLNGKIVQGLEGLGRPWAKTGDEVEAVTLCMTTPSKVWLGPTDKRKYFSLTDWIGRSDEAHGRKRWAWCGQIMGDSAHAAYDAMCALFLLPERAWLFDGYGSTEPWIAYDMTKTAAELEKVGIASILDDAPGGMTLAGLRTRAAGVRQGQSPPGAEAGLGVDAGLIAFNTSGNADFFDLKSGQARPVDVPILRRPAMVYFVHSFSASSPMSRATVGGAWLERGAYAYLGSADEPYLQAFIPTPRAMARLAAGAPWGAAVRMDEGDIWKLVVLGDPLITIGPRGARSDKPAVPLADAEEVGDGLAEQLRGRDFENAMWTLAMTGRDKDAARLLAAVVKDGGEACTARAALAGLGSAFFAGDYQTFLLGVGKAAPDLADPERVRREGLAEVRDMVWQAVWPSMSRPSDLEADALVACLRPEMLERDTKEAILASEFAHGPGVSGAIQQKAQEMRGQSAPGGAGK